MSTGISKEFEKNVFCTSCGVSLGKEHTVLCDTVKYSEQPKYHAYWPDIQEEAKKYSDTAKRLFGTVIEHNTLELEKETTLLQDLMLKLYKCYQSTPNLNYDYTLSKEDLKIIEEYNMNIR